MLRTVVLALLVAACGGDKDTSPGVSTGVSATAEAGKVRELTGKVTATRNGETRALATGGAVSADDVIDTGADGSVVIELAHNNALWSLEAGIKARVDQSVAWGLGKQDAAKPVEHATSSAGRHAGREAADTSSTAAEAPNTAAAPQEPEKAMAMERPADKVAPSQGAKGDPPKPTTAAPQSKDGLAPPRPAAGCDEVSCVLNGDGNPCCAKFKKSGGGGGNSANAPNAAALPESPDRNAIQRAMANVKPRVEACGAKVSVTGTLKISVKVGADGKVTNVEIKQSPDPKVDACVIDAVKKIELPKSRNGVSFTYPITLG